MSDETTAGGEDAPPSRFAGGCVVVVLTGVLLLVVKATVSAAPYVAYFVTGILATCGWQKGRAWLSTRRTVPAAEEEKPAPDVGEALRRLLGDDKGVLLTTLRDDLKLPDTKAVKALLKAEGIPWKAGRTREGNGPSVRREVIPPAPSPPAVEPHGEGCCCRSGDNANSNNEPKGAAGKGLHVEAIGEGGVLVRDIVDRFFAEAAKRHQAATPHAAQGEVADR